MGNCLRRDGAAAARWADDDWDFLAPADDEDGREGLLGHALKRQGSAAASTAATSTEVKIKITKRQLEELLGKVDIKEMSVQQVLAQLIGVGEQFHESRHRPWRPVLQSIPEVD